MYEAVNALPGYALRARPGRLLRFCRRARGDPGQGPRATTPQMAELILSEAEVALVPGAAFGAEGHLRFSFACGMDDLEEAIRTDREIARLKRPIRLKSRHASPVAQ